MYIRASLQMHRVYPRLSLLNTTLGPCSLRCPASLAFSWGTGLVSWDLFSDPAFHTLSWVLSLLQSACLLREAEGGERENY